MKMDLALVSDVFEKTHILTGNLWDFLIIPYVGAAGGAVLMAELLKAKGYITAK